MLGQMGVFRFLKLLSKSPKESKFHYFFHLKTRSITIPLGNIKTQNMISLSSKHYTSNSHGSLCNPHFSFHTPIHTNAELTQFPIASDNKNPEASTDEIAENAEKICTLLSRNYNSEIDPLLNDASVEMSPSLAFEVLRRLSNAGVIALSFFRWAERQNGFKYSVEIYNALIESLGKIKQFKMVWKLVDEMKQKGLLNKDTFALISRRYARAKRVKEAINAFEKMDGFGLKMEGSDFNRLLDVLCKSGQVGSAQEVFDKMKKRRFTPDIKSFTILLEGWGQERNLLRLDEVYREMKDEGFDADVVTYGIIINAYCKAGKYDDAIKVFDEMEMKKCKPSPHIFCTLINGLGSVKRLREVIEFFKLSKAAGFAPEAPTYNAMVGAYCWSMRMDDVYKIVDEMKKCGIGPNSRTYDIILHHLIKAQRTEEAYSVFVKMSNEAEEGCKPTLSTYEIVVRMFCNEGKTDVALKIWDRMKAKGVLPGMHMYSTLINSLHDGDKLDEACKYFDEMLDVGIRPPATLFSNLKQALLDHGRKETVLRLALRIEKLRKTPLFD